MARKTTIYRVTAYGGLIRHYHFARKGAAEAFIREQMAEEDRDADWGTPTIHAVEVALNAAGIAEALDRFVTMTCLNEG